MEDVRNKGCTRRSPPHGLLIFCCKGRVILLVNGSELVKRLVACGWTASNATDTCFQYAAEGKFSELEAFIRQQELLFDDRREYAV